MSSTQISFYLEIFSFFFIVFFTFTYYLCTLITHFVERANNGFLVHDSFVTGYVIFNLVLSFFGLPNGVPPCKCSMHVLLNQ